MAKNKLLVCALGAAMLLGGCSIFDNTTSNNGGEVPSTTSQNGEVTTPIEVTTPEVTTPEITPSTPEVPPSTSVDTNNYVETNEFLNRITSPYSYNMTAKEEMGLTSAKDVKLFLKE